MNKPDKRDELILNLQCVPIGKIIVDFAGCG